jgi:hypothetical protein
MVAEAQEEKCRKRKKVERKQEIKIDQKRRRSLEGT